MIHANLTSDNQTWDFKHPHFKRGDFQSLILVKRKSVRPPSGPSMSGAYSSSSPYQTNMLLDNSGNSDMDPGPSYAHDQSSSQMPYDYSVDEETGVESRIMQLDEKVRHVSTNVANLTSEIHDIKSMIYNQQNIIQELSSLVRTYADSSSTEIPSSSPATDDPSRRNNSLPSIHNLAGDLQSGSLLHHHHHRHHHHHPPAPSLLHQLPRQPSRSPPLAEQEQQRRSSHPSSSGNHSKRNSNPIYPLLNSMPDPMDEN
ncbi:unnamed protein product [Absidia cylindrospora]